MPVKNNTTANTTYQLGLRNTDSNIKTIISAVEKSTNVRRIMLFVQNFMQATAILEIKKASNPYSD